MRRSSKRSMEPLPFSPADWADQRRRKRERHLMLVAALVLVGSTALTVYLSGPSTFLSLASNILIFGLLFLNAILILLLLFLVVRNLVKLFFERRRGIFGAKLRTKFVVAFVGFSVIPAVLLFVVAISYIGKSTELWLNSQIEQSLRMSREVVEAFRQQKGEESLAFARLVGRSLARGELLQLHARPELNGHLEGKRREYQMDLLAVYSGKMDLLGEAFSPKLSRYGQSYGPETAPLKRVLRGEEWSRVRKLGSGEIIEGFVPIYSGYDPKDVIGFAAVGFLVPPALGEQIEVISQTYEQYRQLRSQERPIHLNYYILLTVVLLMVIFLSSWFGFYLAKQITIPLQALAEKTREVASGHLDVRLDEISRDEIGALMESFNQMTLKLRESHLALEASHRELERANVESLQRRNHMEIVLQRIAAGVISLDEEDRITTVNRAAEEMLGISREKVLHRRYGEIVDEQHMDIVQSVVAELAREGKDSLQREIHLSLDGRVLSLNIHVNMLRDEEGRYLGMVVVFDDLTELQKAQRMIAWKEVARRIAHEIKNPLTPIKLSAQRLRKRYLPQMGEGRELLEECTHTIVEQVDHLQNLVNEFQQFARMPSAQPTPQDPNPLVRDVMALYRESHPRVEIQFEAGEGIPMVPLDREQFHQVLINLVNNALAVLPEEGGCIQFRTSFNKGLRVVRLEVADNGPGIRPQDKERLFEPYFSTRESGMGLGLPIVRSIVADHGGYIRVLDRQPRGTRFVIELPL